MSYSSRNGIADLIRAQQGATRAQMPRAPGLGGPAGQAAPAGDINAATLAAMSGKGPMPQAKAVQPPPRTIPEAVPGDPGTPTPANATGIAASPLAPAEPAAAAPVAPGAGTGAATNPEKDAQPEQRGAPDPQAPAAAGSGISMEDVLNHAPWLRPMYRMAFAKGGFVDEHQPEPSGIAAGFAGGGQAGVGQGDGLRSIGAGSRGGRGHFQQPGGGLFRGPVRGGSPGRADHRPGNVARGSYVVPADVVSSLGQGNTESGHGVLGHALKQAKQNRGPIAFAQGGQAGGGEPIPVRLSDGEFVYGPEDVAQLGGPEALDELIASVRAHTAEALKKMPAPR